MRLTGAATGPVGAAGAGCACRGASGTHCASIKSAPWFITLTLSCQCSDWLRSPTSRKSVNNSSSFGLNEASNVAGSTGGKGSYLVRNLNSICTPSSRSDSLSW